MSSTCEGPVVVARAGCFRKNRGTDVVGIGHVSTQAVNFITHNQSRGSCLSPYDFLVNWLVCFDNSFMEEFFLLWHLKKYLHVTVKGKGVRCAEPTGKRASQGPVLGGLRTL